MILERLERALILIGEKVIDASGSYDTMKHHDDFNTMTSELVIKPKKPLVERSFDLETHESLKSKTKDRICELAEERYGISLKKSMRKDDLIVRYLEIQEYETA